MKSFMKANGIAENAVDGVVCIMLMVIFMKESGLEIKEMAKEC